MPDQPITIRSLGPEDVELLERPLPGPFDFSFDATRAWTFLALRSNVLVVALEGRSLVGFGAGTVMMHPVRDTALYVSEIEVHADRRRRGIGRRLTRALLDAAADRGCAHLWLKADRGNTAAQALYDALGARRGDASDVFVWDL